MKIRFTFILVTLSICQTLFSQNTFQKIYESSVSNQAYDIVALSDGGFAYFGIVDSVNGDREVLLTKIDCVGDLAWSKKYGPTNSENNTFGGILETSNGDIVFAYNIGDFENYNILSARVDSEGNTLWKKQYGDTRDDIARDIIQTQDGNFVIAGATGNWGTDTTGLLAYTDAYLFKIDQSNGDLIWTQTYGLPASTDGAYAVAEDAEGNLVSAGQFMIDTSFYCFLLKTDPSGNELFFKGLGQDGHTSMGFDVLPTSEGHYVITGITTIAKSDFNSDPDPFLIKVDSVGNNVFTNVYTLVSGDDFQDGGSSIVELEDGSFAIGVSSNSFTNYTSGFFDNKNAIYFIAADGTFTGATLYNNGGSHESRLHPTVDGGYVMSGYTNQYNSSSFDFRPLVIKMKANFISGCNEIPVDSEVEMSAPIWNIVDIISTNLTGGQANNYLVEKTFVYDAVNTLCETISPVVADFSFESACEGESVFFTDGSDGNILSWNWSFDNNDLTDVQDPEFVFSGTGTFPVQLIVSDGCQQDTSEQNITIGGTVIGSNLDTVICTNEPFVFHGTTYNYSSSGNNNEVATLVSSLGCDSIVSVTIEVNNCGCDIEFPNVFTPNNDGTNDDFKAYVACDYAIVNYRMRIFDRWGETVFDSFDYKKGWDGTINGLAIPTDVFVYSVSFDIDDGTSIEHRNEIKDVTLIR